MKVLCYGASVTAQKDNSGYFQKLTQQCQTIEFKRLSFGASHFDYAGFAYCSMISQFEPDVVIIDWLTPSMKIFSPIKIKLFHEYLQSLNVKVIWINFPRKDDLDNERVCYKQIVESCADFGFRFIDIVKEYPSFKREADVFLRDIVHTTEKGAMLYSDILIENISRLTNRENQYKDNCFNLDKLPQIYQVEKSIDNTRNVHLSVASSRGELEVFIHCKVGPNIPYLKVTVSLNDFSISKTINPADAWCYYERNMVLPPVRFKLDREELKGKYKVIIEPCEGEPLDEIALKGTVREELIKDNKQAYCFNVVIF